jgi:HAD superfamily hydrolase (TIGR01662 family)
MIRAVIFDLGSTLWDWDRNRGADESPLDRAYAGTHATLCERLTCTVPDAGALKTAVGEALKADMDYFTTGTRLDQPPTWTWVDRGFRKLGLELDQQLLDEITPPLFATEIEHLICHDGTLDAVQELHERGYRLGCVTNTLADEAAIRAMLRLHGFEPLIDGLVVSADEGWRKPHPSLFEKSLRQLDSTPAEAVFVGDSPYHDVGGAQAVGMRAVLTTQYIARPTEGMPVPDATITHLRELPAVIEAWSA